MVTDNTAPTLDALLTDLVPAEGDAPPAGDPPAGDPPAADDPLVVTDPPVVDDPPAVYNPPVVDDPPAVDDPPVVDDVSGVLPFDILEAAKPADGDPPAPVADADDDVTPPEVASSPKAAHAWAELKRENKAHKTREAELLAQVEEAKSSQVDTDDVVALRAQVTDYEEKLGKVDLAATQGFKGRFDTPMKSLVAKGSKLLARAGMAPEAIAATMQCVFQAKTQAQIDTPVTEVIKTGDLFCEQHRVAYRKHYHRHPKPQPGGASCGIGHQAQTLHQRYLDIADDLILRPRTLQSTFFSQLQTVLNHAGISASVEKYLGDRDAEFHSGSLKGFANDV